MSMVKKIPGILQDPIVISEDEEPDNVNVFGDVWVGNLPVLVGIIVSHLEASQTVINKVRTAHARRDAAQKLTADKLLYVNPDKKRTQSWSQTLGTLLPPSETQMTSTGLIRSIARDETDVNENIRYQPREEEYVSNREILANALEGAAQSVAERNRIAEYRMRIRSLDIAQNRVSNIREEITEVNMMIREAKGAEKNQLIERLENLQAQKSTLEREMNETNKVLLKLEATEPLKLVVNRERKAAMDKVRAKADDSRSRDAIHGVRNYDGHRRHVPREWTAVRGQKQRAAVLAGTGSGGGRGLSDE